MSDWETKVSVLCKVIGLENICQKYVWVVKLMLAACTTAAVPNFFVINFGYQITKNTAENKRKKTQLKSVLSKCPLIKWVHSTQKICCI